MASFAKDVVTGIDVPQVQAPDFTQNSTTAQDVVGLASFGLGLKAKSDAKEAKIAALQKQESMAQTVLKLSTQKTLMADQKFSSHQINKAQNKLLSNFSAVDQLTIKEEAAKAAHGGPLLQKTIDAELSRSKAERDYNDSVAQEIGDARATPENQERRDTYVKHQQALALEIENHKADLRTLEKSGKTIANDNLVAGKQAKVILSSISNAARLEVDKELASIKNRINSTDPSQRITIDQGKEQLVLAITTGTTNINNQITAMAAEQSPLVRSELLAGTANLTTQYNDYVDMLTSVTSGDRYFQLLEKRMKNDLTVVKSNLLEDGPTRTVTSLIELGFMDAGTLKSSVGASALKATSTVIGSIERTIKGSLLPAPESKDSFLSKLWRNNEGSDGSPVSSTEAEATEVITEEVNRVSKDIMDGVIGEGREDWYNVIASNLTKTMDDVINSPKIGQFKPHAVDSVIGRILDTSFKKFSESTRKEIGDKIGDYASRFFGTVNSGSFIPAIDKAYRNAVPSVAGDKKLFTLSMKPTTKNIQVDLVSDKIIKESLTSQTLGKEPSDTKVEQVKQSLLGFKRHVEGNKVVTDVLNATAKASGSDKELVTSLVLDQISKNSDIGVDERFIIKTEPVRYEIGSPSSEAVVTEEAIAQAMQEAGITSETKDLINALQNATSDEEAAAIAVELRKLNAK